MADNLYRQAILSHYRSPRHRRELPDANVQASAADPLCGDELTVSARIAEGRVVDAAFQARGCSISQASADMMIDAVRGASTMDAEQAISAFEALLRGSISSDEATALGEASVLAGVRQFPARLKCALLPWKTLREALATPVPSARGESP